MYEAEGLTAEGAGAYIMRSLLSEGRLDLGTVDKNETGGLEGRKLTKEGPTALFTSTIRNSLEPQLETRALSLTVDDTAAQSRKIVTRQGEEEEGRRRA